MSQVITKEQRVIRILRKKAVLRSQIEEFTNARYKILIHLRRDLNTIHRLWNRNLTQQLTFLVLMILERDRKRMTKIRIKDKRQSMNERNYTLG
jgi:hypothetical protein